MTRGTLYWGVKATMARLGTKEKSHQVCPDKLIGVRGAKDGWMLPLRPEGYIG
jgi:hypothetical protein